MNDAKQRVKEELDELVIKTNKLIAFTLSEKFYELTCQMRDLLKNQVLHMLEYAEILSRRLNIWDKTQKELDEEVGGYSIGHVL